ncbi:TPA: hypothetical protein ACJIWY_001356 [Enterobacter bugandensis]
MKAILFDLDNTLFATQECNVYLRSRAGREVVCDLIRQGSLNVTPLDARLPGFINMLDEANDLDVFIISDSPKDYCITILNKFGITVSHDKVLGAMHKPCVEEEVEGIFSDYEKVLVVGDTPKDIYFAHRLKAASVFLTCLTDYDINFSVNNSVPSAVAKSYIELVDVINDFLRDELTFEIPYFKPHFKTVDADTAFIVDIADENIGFAMKYIPELDDIDNEEDKFTWFKIHRSIKPAKILSYSDLDAKKKVSFYNNNSKISEGVAFRDVAWFARISFVKWLQDKNITGKVYLVAAPSSVPRECNKSLPMEILVHWWVKWLPYISEGRFQVLNGNYVERFWPTTPAHMSKGRREIRPHFHTLGVFNDANPYDEDTSAIIIIDDVVTSGTQMKAVASLLQGTGMIPRGVPIYGYALAKTTRASVSDDFTKLMEAFSKAEKSGG